MLLDVLSGIDYLYVFTAYQLDGKVIHTIPSRVSDFERCKPIYEKLPGWEEDVTNIKKYEDLPQNAKKYIEFIEKEIGVPIKMVSNGPKRHDIIHRA